MIRYNKQAMLVMAFVGLGMMNPAAAFFKFPKFKFNTESFKKAFTVERLKKLFTPTPQKFGAIGMFGLTWYGFSKAKNSQQAPIQAPIVNVEWQFVPKIQKFEQRDWRGRVTSESQVNVSITGVNGLSQKDCAALATSSLWKTVNKDTLFFSAEPSIMDDPNPQPNGVSAPPSRMDELYAKLKARFGEKTADKMLSAGQETYREEHGEKAPAAEQYWGYFGTGLSRNRTIAEGLNSSNKCRISNYLPVGTSGEVTWCQGSTNGITTRNHFNKESMVLLKNELGRFRKEQEKAKQTVDLASKAPVTGQPAATK